MLIQVGPGANAVGCQDDPTRLAPGQIHCRPVIALETGLFLATGAPTVLKRLMEARHQAQSVGITIDGEIRGNAIAVSRVIVASPVSRAAPVAAPVVTRPPPVVLFETELEGFVIKLTAERV